MANDWRPADSIHTLKNKESLPAYGHPGEIFYCTDVNKLMVWQEDSQSWAAINTALSRELFPVDELNDRRGAIRDQKARKANR